MWSLQVKVDNPSFITPIPSATESWVFTESSLVYFSLPTFVYLISEPMNIFWLSIFNKSALYLDHKHFLGLLEWFKDFIIFKNIALTSSTRSSCLCGRGLISWRILEKIPYTLQMSAQPEKLIQKTQGYFFLKAHLASSVLLQSLTALLLSLLAIRLNNASCSAE